ncbi:dihydrofolate reductase [Lutibacter profundi]|uniref:Dihydrofolate reductase n=1 Tax=Lutibacter profundi TaxID=1622118 RepID=A0A0X8G650_9FLAO|nr:dihydrofolate reductase [Lutibacter profundi]AMC10813.1 dihydrofolate reductase [Lutibacter profundi]
MKIKYFLVVILMTSLLFSCSNNSKEDKNNKEVQTPFNYEVEQFADVKILRYQIPGFNELSLKQKELVYYLSQAGMVGRDIMYDQNYRHNLKIRRALEHIYTNYKGDKTTDDWKNFETYLKRIWFSNGIHHHYSNDKFKPAFSQEYFDVLLKETNTKLTGEAYDVIFNDADAKKVNLDASKGLLKGSAINFYSPNITEHDVDAFYASKIDKNDTTPIEYGLNSKLIKKEDGTIVEKVWKVGGMYDKAIEKIVYWLGKAVTVAENDKQAKALNLLIEYYKTGDLKIWDDYNIVWATSTEGDIDYINGFIEVYNDPKAFRGSYETIVQIKDFDMSKKMAVVSKNAQWFEDNSTIDENHKKKNVVGVSYKTVNVASEAGDASPSTPIGVNLPNNNWIRQQHGSKSVSLGNLIEAYNQAGGTDKLKEFAFDEAEVNAEIKYGHLADKLHTALHEVIGHASGKINPGVGQPKETLKNYSSTLEEARADLVGLYYLPDEKLVEMKLSPNAVGIGKAAYDGYIRNGLITQLIRLNLGDDIEEAHMRNRQLVASWAFEKGKKENVIEKVVKNNKTYFVIRDYDKLRTLFGDLLREIQRIKSEGDFEAGKALVETYGVKVDQAMHKEVLERNSKFKSAPYSGFVNPVLVAEKDAAGNITAIKVTQPTGFAAQMLDYAKRYTTLPDTN